MNVNKTINKHHKELDKVLDEMIIQDLERVGNAYFKKYQPMIDTVNTIVEECYSYNVMSEELYDEIINRFVEVCVQANGEQRKAEIDNMIQRACDDNIDKYYDAIYNILGKPVIELAHRGLVTRDRCILEDRRAELRLNKKRKRFTDMYVNEIDKEFISVIFFVRDALIDYGKAGRVIWNEEEEIEVEVIEYDKSNKYVKMTQVDEVIRFLEKKGYRKVRQAGTSHAIYKNMKTQHCIPVPIHGKEINIELAYGIQRQVYQVKNN